MNCENYFEDTFESFSDYRKIVLIMFLVQNNENFLREVSFSERFINQLNLEFKNILIEQPEEYLDYITNEEKSVFEKLLNK